MNDIPLTIAETQKGLTDKKFSAVELVDSYLSRINKYDRKINAFITVSDESAYKQAKKVDISMEKPPLFGVVTAYKDIFMTEGVRTTAGANLLKDYIPSYSATVVTKLEKAGCIMIGKTNCDAWAHGSSGENSDFGPTKNPWDLSKVAGGSSSGSAASLTSNFSLIATGTDTCGSIRVPANFCYTYGLKPTYGAVSRYGIIAMASSLDSVGHFGRCVDDIERVYLQTVGSDGKDATVNNFEYEEKNIKPKLRIGIASEFFGSGVEAEVEQTVKGAAKIFKKEGIELVDVKLPHTKDAISVYYIIQPAEVSSNLGRFDEIRFGGSRDKFSDEAKRRIMLGTYVLSSGYYDAYYLKAMKVRSIIIAELNKVFEQVDALIAPVAPTSAFKLGDKTNDPLKMYLTDIYAATANLCGIPSLAIPFGFSKNGLPLGFQLMGSRFSEKTLFALAKLFEKETDYKPKVANI